MNRSALKSALFVLGCLYGCGRSAAPMPYSGPAPTDPWVLTCRNPNETEPAVLWNGKIGIRIGRDGTGSGQPFFRINAYDRSPEEKILALPNPLNLTATVDGVRLDPAQGRDYEQTLDMRTGVLNTAWTQSVGARDVVWAGEVCIEPASMRMAAWWHFFVAKGGMFRQGDVTSRLRSSGAGDFYWMFDGHRTRPSDFNHFLHVANASAAAWRKRWQTDIEIDGPAEDQQAIHSLLFYLRSAIDPSGMMSISPYGLSSQRYNGHVFWDADIWVFPALALIEPGAARAIPSYRVRTLAAARRGKFLQFPWEGSVSGRETAPKAARGEAHISGDVAWCAAQAAALGLLDGGKAKEIQDGVRAYFDAISEPSPRGREIRHVLSTDEYGFVDNDLYTNALADWLSPRRFYLPRDQFTLLTYDGDGLRAYKQADAVLSMYPLQNRTAVSSADRMMDRFADKVTLNGPAMTHSVNAIVWAREGQVGKAYDEWRASWRPYTRSPLMLFSEKTVKPATYFTTGAAGALQSVLFGFLGIRLDEGRTPTAAWSKPLRNGFWLSITPHLPNTWRSLRFKNMAILGRRYTVEVERTGKTRVTVGSEPPGP